MFRTASFYKARMFAQLAVNVYEDSDCDKMELQVLVNFENGKFHAITAIPRSYRGHNPVLIADEFRRVFNFLDERNWRNRCKDYNLIVSDVL